MEKRYVRKDGRIVWILLSTSLLRDPDGRPRYYIAQIADVTQRKRFEMERFCRHSALWICPGTSSSARTVVRRGTSSAGAEDDVAHGAGRDQDLRRCLRAVSLRRLDHRPLEARYLICVWNEALQADVAAPRSGGRIASDYPARSWPR
jgi:hypothetical protein